MSRTYSQKKVEYFEHMTELLGQYKRLLFVEVDNVQSQQMHNIRRGLRGQAEILMGKNTLMRRIITDKAASANATPLDKILCEKVIEAGSLVGNLGIIFTNSDFEPIQQVIQNNRANAPARVGAVSPVDVTIPAGSTGLDPGATSFFQALQINTKIVKGAVEIVTEKKVLSVGEKVDNSVAVLLQKLNIKPFFYGLQIKFVFDNGDVYGPEVLELNDKVFEQGMKNAITNVAAVSLATGIPTEPALPHVITTAFKNLLSVCLGTEYTFEEFNGKAIVEAVKSGKSLGGAAAPAAAAAKPAAAAAKAEPVEEEDDDMGFGLFD
jgi:large subunit ribosomal protein LP0